MAYLRQVRAMQIIDALESSRRGPYGGGIGHVSFTGGMDMALALRTMVRATPLPVPYPTQPYAQGPFLGTGSRACVHLPAR